MNKKAMSQTSTSFNYYFFKWTLIYLKAGYCVFFMWQTIINFPLMYCIPMQLHFQTKSSVLGVGSRVPHVAQSSSGMEEEGELFFFRRRPNVLFSCVCGTPPRSFPPFCCCCFFQGLQFWESYLKSADDDSASASLSLPWYSNS